MTDPFGRPEDRSGEKTEPRIEHETTGVLRGAGPTGVEDIVSVQHVLEYQAAAGADEQSRPVGQPQPADRTELKPRFTAMARAQNRT